MLRPSLSSLAAGDRRPEPPAEHVEHVARRGVEIVLGAPAPLDPRGVVLEAVGPGVGEGLAHRVDLVADLELRDVAADVGGLVFGTEAHRGHVEGVAVAQARGVGLHQVDGGLDGVGHVDHVEVRVAGQKAAVGAGREGGVVDVHGVVGGAAAGRRDVRDDAGVAHPPRVDTEALVVVVAEKLAGDLCDPVHRRQGAGSWSAA